MAIYRETERKIFGRTIKKTGRISPGEHFYIHIGDDDEPHLKRVQILTIKSDDTASETLSRGWFGDGEFNTISPILYRRELTRSQIKRTVALPFGAHMKIYWREE